MYLLPYDSDGVPVFTEDDHQYPVWAGEEPDGGCVPVRPGKSVRSKRTGTSSNELFESPFFVTPSRYVACDPSRVSLDKGGRRRDWNDEGAVERRSSIFRFCVRIEFSADTPMVRLNLSFPQEEK